MRPRIKYFDIIKFFAVTFVLVCHYSRTLEAYGIQYSWKILPDELFHVYTGTVGSMLFSLSADVYWLITIKPLMI